MLVLVAGSKVEGETELVARTGGWRGRSFGVLLASFFRLDRVLSMSLLLTRQSGA